MRPFKNDFLVLFSSQHEGIENNNAYELYVIDCPSVKPPWLRT